MAEPKLHPAEHRGYRELNLAGRHLLQRWRRLAEQVDDTDAGPALANAAMRVNEMLGSLSPRIAAYDLHGKPAAQGLGARAADLRSGVLDRGLDTGVAVRLAVLDIEHVASLLGQLARMATARGDRSMERFCRSWEERLRREVDSVREAAIALGSDPDRSAAPLDSSTLGQVVHRAGWAFGTLGEWFDRRLARGGDGDSGGGESDAGAAAVRDTAEKDV